VISAEEALRFGMVDRLFPEGTLLENAVSFAKCLITGRAPRPPKKKDLTTWFFEDTFAGRALVFSRAKKDVLSKTKGKYPAPLSILGLISKTYGRKGEHVYRQESASFSELAVTEVSKNLIQVFFLSEKYKKQRWTQSSVTSDGIKKCGVIGAGVMGGGIAQLVSFREIPVRVKDISEKALAGALKEAQSLYQKALKRRKLKKHELENKMNLISVGLTNDGLKNCGILIEAVVEDLGIKQKVFKDIAALTGPETVLASNTSSLPVTKMAEGCQYPERIVGLHFFNPVSQMPLVEVIRAAQSSDDAIERTIQFSRRLGKTVILVQDRPGFLVNRLLLPYMNEAAYLLGEGFTPASIDAIAENFGMPMGPVELVDQVGVDVGYKVAHILEEAFGARMKVAPILQSVKEKGWLGKKAQKGFYLYEGKRKSQNPGLVLGARAIKISSEDALKRMVYVMINEAARCLEEKVVDGPATVDIGMIMGTGFPPFLGGLLRYADSVGLSNILKDLERFQKEADPKRFEPCATLRELASRDRFFYEA
jgi:3-hydroxyacyl-CoA dehydrogenase/enoyl-CoA hydratase/3-hydroxybutyryl-CoA epimerase